MTLVTFWKEINIHWCMSKGRYFYFSLLSFSPMLSSTAVCSSASNSLVPTAQAPMPSPTFLLPCLRSLYIPYDLSKFPGSALVPLSRTGKTLKTCSCLSKIMRLGIWYLWQSLTKHVWFYRPIARRWWLWIGTCTLRRLILQTCIPRTFRENLPLLF